MSMKNRIFLVVCLVAATVHAQLAVTVWPPEVTATRAVVKLELKNNVAEKIESARAVCFLTDAQGKAVGHATRWVIGGTPERPPLEPGATNVFHFVVASPDSSGFATRNLTARVNFSRVVLAGGKLADPVKDVQINTR